MRKIEVIGRNHLLDDTLRVLQQHAAVHLAPAAAPGTDLLSGPAADEPTVISRLDAVRSLIARTRRVLGAAVTGPAGPPMDEPALAADLARTEPITDRLDERLAGLAAEESSLPRYLAALDELLPLAPELTEMTDVDLRRRHLATAALVLDARDERVVDLLRGALTDTLGDRFELTAARTDPDTVGCLIVYPHADRALVQRVLGSEHVTHQSLPAAYTGFTLRESLQRMRRRLAAVPGERAAVLSERAGLVADRAPRWRATLDQLTAEQDRLQVRSLLGRTERTFVLTGWVPRDRLPGLRRDVAAEVSGEIVITRVDPGPGEEPPVLLRNRRAARPYESLVRFLALPKVGTIDPTGLTALVMPVLFGVMVGDVGYGLGLLGIALLVRRRFRGRSQLGTDISQVLLAGAVSSIVFGLLFGEFFGSLGNQLGMPALWFYRGGPAALEPLLLLAVGIGAAHILLGLVLGVYQAARDRRRTVALERIGTLLVLLGLFAMAGVLASVLPAGTMTPAVAAAVVGLVLVSSLHGALGVLTGPLELLGTIGNVLSYLRLAAVGLASVYLANVANVLATTGPLVLGVLVAVFFHTLNLALAAFSPMVQSLRLHYVEFYSKFFEGGAPAYAPFGAPAEPAQSPTPG